MINVLIVEDDPARHQSLAKALTDYGLSVQLAEDAAGMRHSLLMGGVDVVLLDHTLSDGCGVYLCREIRLTSNVPVILLSSEDDKLIEILGLELGADDFILRPVGPRALLARIRAVLRRARLPIGRWPSQTISTSDPGCGVLPGENMEWPCSMDPAKTWVVDWRKQELISPDNSAFPLSGAESRILAVLLRSPERVLTRTQLVEMTNMRSGNVGHRAVDLAISRLRAKLKEPPQSARFIRTVRGEGYRFRAGSIVELALDR